MDSAKSAANRHASVDDLERFLVVSDPQISPDGNHVVFTRQHVGDRNQYVTNLWRVPTTGGSAHQFSAGDSDRHPRWSPDGDRISFVSGRDKEAQNVFVIPTDGGEAAVLTQFTEGRINTFEWSADGRYLAVAWRPCESEWTTQAKKEREESGASTPPRVIDELYYRLDGDGYFNDQRFGVYLVDTKTGKHKPVFTKDTVGWFGFGFAPDSRQLIVSATTSRNPLMKPWQYDLYTVNIANGRSTKIDGLPRGEKSSVTWSPDGEWIAYAGRSGKEIWGSRNTQLFVCRPDGSDHRCLTEDVDYCLEAVVISDTAEANFSANLIWSRDSRRVFFALGLRGGRQIASASLTGDVVVHTSGRRTMEPGNLSGNGSKMAATVGAMTKLAEVGVIGVTRKPGKLKFSRLTNLNDPLLKSIDAAAADPVTVTAADGARVHAWVMKPPGFRKGHRYPAILQVHGGPHGMYGEAFFHEFQCLAAAGYVVVFGNPRGSKGYGEDHCDVIRGDWGNRDWVDVQAIAGFMREQPFIDSNRIGIMGGSYGGYMTNWAIGHSDEFAAAITDRCVSNLVSMAGSSDIPLVPGYYWPGNPWDKSEALWAQSPIRYFANVKTPTLVIHSEGDLRCNVEQGEQVFSALKSLGVPTRFVRYPQCTSHGLSRCGPPDLRKHRLEQILAWWKQYLS